MELIMCIFTQERKDPSQKIIKKEILDNENFVLIKECSWYGCGLEFSNLRPVLKKARVCGKYYAFCCDDCYLLWLKTCYY